MLFREITARNFLSFGSETPPLELRNLNVFIGPNAAGKSNLMEAIAFLRASAGDLRSFLTKGGVSEWICKDSPEGIATVEVVVEKPPQFPCPLRHSIGFQAMKQGFVLNDERIENSAPDFGCITPYFYYRYNAGHPMVNVRREARKLVPDQVESDKSILVQRKDPDTFPEITYLSEAYDKIRSYREWAFGKNAVFREPQKADLRNDRLEDDFSNLGMFLNKLRRTSATKRKILAGLKDLYEGFEDFDVSVEGGTVQVFFTEGDFNIPATRLSDGTLRYLCLLAILCDPAPPPLICIEEPELGLHPDILPKLADYLVDASTRTQLVVTTHSDVLVDAMTEHPEDVIVCEKHEGHTSMRRLDADSLTVWLDKYSLGELWTSGELGGVRW